MLLFVYLEPLGELLAIAVGRGFSVWPWVFAIYFLPCFFSPFVYYWWNMRVLLYLCVLLTIRNLSLFSFCFCLFPNSEIWEDKCSTTFFHFYAFLYIFWNMRGLWVRCLFACSFCPESASIIYVLVLPCACSDYLRTCFALCVLWLFACSFCSMRALDYSHVLCMCRFCPACSDHSHALCALVLPFRKGLLFIFLQLSLLFQYDLILLQVVLLWIKSGWWA